MITHPLDHRKYTYVIGVDEVGRGPLAGPLAIGAVSINISKKPHRSFLSGIKDSKKLTPIGREIWFAKMKEAKKHNLLNYKIAFIDSKRIDKKGLTWAIGVAIQRAISRLGLNPKNCLVLLDGGLKAPAEFLFQKTIIRGDEKEPIIGLASIAAKVTRDKRMEKLSLLYPDFDFHIHKGYGTKLHREKIKKFGTCEIHRMSFLKNILNS
jgi:ribonuclease HII